MKKLKNKILSGLIFLLMVIILLSLTGILSIYYLSQDSKAIIADNYASVEYSHKMLQALESIFLTELKYTGPDNSKSPEDLMNLLAQAKKDFEHNLRLQQNNITEAGEEAVVKEISESYLHFIVFTDSLNNNMITADLLSLTELRSRYKRSSSVIGEIHSINMGAIKRKSDIAGKTADDVMTYMALAAAASILITLAFIFYFPGYIIFPITELTKRIKDISNRKYDQRILISSGDELKTLAEAFNEMAAGLKKHEAERINELLFEKRRMEILILHLNDGILLLDNRTKILLVNDKFCELINLKRAELLGMEINDIDPRNEIISHIKSVELSGTQRESKPFRIQKKDKQEYYQIRILDLGHQGKENFVSEAGGYIILFQNVTEYQERDLAKTSLMATVSHELKTPLSSINLSVKLLQDERIGQLNEEQKKYIDSIRLQSGRILKLVNEVLDFAQAETGHIILSIKPNDVNDIIELGTFAVLMQINEKEIELELKIPSNLPKVKCDLEKTVWVIVNLLSNAVRYSSPKSKIVISAGHEENFIRFSVKDHGHGISHEDQKRIFAKYVKSRTDPEKGSGLGLAIAKEFVEVQGGMIGFESVPPTGSEFYFSLPTA